MNISIVIPTYKPDQKFYSLIEILHRQTMPINQYVIINTEKKYFDEFNETYGILEKFPDIEVYHHSITEFDHGKSRNYGVEKTNNDIFICMTQDAVPADSYLVENLVKGLFQEKVAVVYGRQLPNHDCNEVEKYTRSYNYPKQSYVKTEKDLLNLGIKTYFCSNVCAAYRKEIWKELDGFINHTIFNEDMIFAASVIKAGYGIGYVADAMVFHSHNYNNMQQFKRNFDLGVSQADHPEVFAEIPSESEGIKLVSNTIKHLWKKKCKKEIIPMVITTGYKFIGFKLGKKYKKLSDYMITKCTMNLGYWEKDKEEK